MKTMIFCLDGFSIGSSFDEFFDMQSVFITPVEITDEWDRINYNFIQDTSSLNYIIDLIKTCNDEEDLQDLQEQLCEDAEKLIDKLADDLEYEINYGKHKKISVFSDILYKVTKWAGYRRDYIDAIYYNLGEVINEFSCHKIIIGGGGIVLHTDSASTSYYYQMNGDVYDISNSCGEREPIGLCSENINTEQMKEVIDKCLECLSQ